MSQKSQQKSQLFRIHVRPDLKATKVEKGYLNLEGEEQGQLVEAFIAPTPQTIPNFYNHLVVKKIVNGLYNGQFEFVNGYDDKRDVESIELRYIENCPSLDKKWQISKGYEPKSAQAYVGWTYPSNEIQEFDLAKEPPLFIEFLRHHQGNGNNPNRDKNNGVMFIEVNAGERINAKKDNFKKQKEQIEFIDKIHDNDDIVNIYASLLQIGSHYELAIKRDEVLGKLEEVGTESFISMISEYKAKDSEFLSSWLDTKQLKIKDKELFLVGTPPTKLFSSEEFKSESSTDLIKEVIELAYTKESVFNELQKIKQDLNT